MSPVLSVRITTGAASEIVVEAGGVNVEHFGTTLFYKRLLFSVGIEFKSSKLLTQVVGLVVTLSVFWFRRNRKKISVFGTQPYQYQRATFLRALTMSLTKQDIFIILNGEVILIPCSLDTEHKCTRGTLLDAIEETICHTCFVFDDTRAFIGKINCAAADNPRLQEEISYSIAATSTSPDRIPDPESICCPLVFSFTELSESDAEVLYSIADTAWDEVRNSTDFGNVTYVTECLSSMKAAQDQDGTHAQVDPAGFLLSAFAVVSGLYDGETKIQNCTGDALMLKNKIEIAIGEGADGCTASANWDLLHTLTMYTCAAPANGKELISIETKENHKMTFNRGNVSFADLMYDHACLVIPYMKGETFCLLVLDTAYALKPMVLSNDAKYSKMGLQFNDTSNYFQLVNYRLLNGRTKVNASETKAGYVYDLLSSRKIHSFYTTPHYTGGICTDKTICAWTSAIEILYKQTKYIFCRYGLGLCVSAFLPHSDTFVWPMCSPFTQ